MYKKLIAYVLICITIFTSAAYGQSASSGVEIATNDVAQISVKGIVYDVRTISLGENNLKKIVTYNGKTEEFTIKDNKMYSEDGELLATFSEEIENSVGTRDSIGWQESTTSSYPSNSYDYFKTIKGNVHLSKKASLFTTAALAAIIGYVAPPI